MSLSIFIFLLKRKSKIKGVVAMTELSNRRLWISFIYLEKDVRRRGFGKKFMAHIKMYMRRNNYFKIQTGILLTNKVSLSFFEEMGFKDVVLVKELTLKEINGG